MPSKKAIARRENTLPVQRYFSWAFSLEFAMVLAALLLRISLLMLPENVTDDASFNNEVSNIATSLANGDGFSSPFAGHTGPTAWIPPIYPFLCSLIFRAAGGYGKNGITWAVIMSSFFSALTCIPLFHAAKRIFDRKIALTSGWIFALCPYFARMSVAWLWETTLSGLFMTWMFLMILQLRDHDTLRNWIKYGIVWGIAMLNNPSILTLVAVSMLWFLEWQGRKSWKHIATAILVCGVVISPWLLRNRIALHKWIFIRSNFGFEFNLGNYHGSPGTCGGRDHPYFSKYELDLYTRLGEAEYAAYHGAAAKQFVRQYPGEFVRLCWSRFRKFWDGEVLSLRPDWRPVWLPQLYLPFTITTALGLLLMAYRRFAVSQLMFLAIILYPWPYYISCIQSRFRYLIDPMMLMITVYLFFEITRFLAAAAKRYKEHGFGQAPDTSA